MGKVRCSRLDVKCCVNDPVDVRAGGPQYLGFDFNVLEEKTDIMTKYIEGVLKELSVPLIEISNNGIKEVDEEHVWDEDRIFNEIEVYSSYMISESNRNYKVVPKKYVKF